MSSIQRKIRSKKLLKWIFGTKPISKDNGDNLINKDNEVVKMNLLMK